PIRPPQHSTLFPYTTLFRSQTTRMPTVLERSGDLSAARNTLGPVQIFDPVSGVSFPGNLIPQSRITPEARALLGLYPLPNFDGKDRKSTRLNSSHVAISYAV